MWCDVVDDDSMSASASTGSWYGTPADGGGQQHYYVTPDHFDVQEDAHWGQAEEAAYSGPPVFEEAAWPGPMIEEETTIERTTRRFQPRRQPRWGQQRGRQPRWGQQLAPPRRNFNFRVTQFRRQDLKRKETSLKVWLVPENWNRQTVADNSSLRASSSQELTPDEMTARKKAHTRRHCLVQTMENTFELLPPDHPVYQREDVWKHSQEVHQNAYGGSKQMTAQLPADV